MNLRCYSDKIFQFSSAAQELLQISNEISHNYLPIAPSKKSEKKTNAGLSAQELLKVSQNISRYYAPQKTSKNTSLTLLAIDPCHLYVNCNLAENNLSPLLHAMNNNELTLRVYSQPEQNKALTHFKPFSENTIHNIQFQKIIKIPKTCEHTVYYAYIGKNTLQNDFISLAKSNDIHTCISASSTTPSANAVDFEKRNLAKPIYSHSLFNTPKHYAATNQSGQRKKIVQP